MGTAIQKALGVAGATLGASAAGFWFLSATLSQTLADASIEPTRLALLQGLAHQENVWSATFAVAGATVGLAMLFVGPRPIPQG